MTVDAQDVEDGCLPSVDPEKGCTVEGWPGVFFQVEGSTTQYRYRRLREEVKGLIQRSG